MQRSSVPGEERIQGNPLEFHLRMFATALSDAGYRDRAMCSKLGLLADLGLWLKRTGLWSRAIFMLRDPRRLHRCIFMRTCV